MTTKAPYKRVGNGLSLLANKCASRTFDISTGMVYASMRDQIVRAQLLIRDLHNVDSDCKNILVVGAGIAGATAASSAASLGIKTVVVESKSLPFSLQQGVTKRMVGPFMYEWPSIVSGSQDYPPIHASLGQTLSCMPQWNAAKPITADDLVKRIMPWFNTLISGPNNPKFYFDCDSTHIKEYVQSFVAHEALKTGTSMKCPAIKLPDGKEFSPDYVVLAVGMGRERTHLIDGTEHIADCVRGTAFWKNDDLRDTPEMNWSVGVFGGGDGALQDVLRLITKYDHPLELIDALRANPDSVADELEARIPELEALEQQSRLLATWSKEIYDLIDEKCKEVCRDLAKSPLVRKKVRAQIRMGTGKVVHVHRGANFTKAYLLNRFCVHLIEQCMLGFSARKRVVYERILNSDAILASTNSLGKHLVKVSTGEHFVFDKIVVRFGPSKEDLEKQQLMKLMPETKEDRTSLAAIPLPFAVAK